jgi:hypothetical protein
MYLHVEKILGTGIHILTFIKVTLGGAIKKERSDFILNQVGIGKFETQVGSDDRETNRASGGLSGICQANCFTSTGKHNALRLYRATGRR